MAFSTSTLPARFASKIEVASITGCWNWKAAKDRRGYGRYTVCRGTTTLTHRYAYEVLVGDPGPCLDHLCLNTSCCNPEHLDPVTLAENSRRMFRGLKTVNAERLARTHCPQGHEYNDQNTYRYDNCRQCRACTIARARQQDRRRWRR